MDSKWSLHRHHRTVVTVGVYSQIGFRLEPQGRSGFAHFEAHDVPGLGRMLRKGKHIKLTFQRWHPQRFHHYGRHQLFESVPSNALERVLWLEADRMRALKVDDENLRNQRDVVKEEVRVNVLNQPLWRISLARPSSRGVPATGANAHNFYGDFADLDAASLADVQSFFKTYYAPNKRRAADPRATLKPDEGLALAKKYFGDTPAGAPPPFADPREPEQTEERRGEVEEKFGTLPADGYWLYGSTAPDQRMVCNDPARSGASWSRAGRMYRHLVLERQVRRVDCCHRIFGYHLREPFVTKDIVDAAIDFDGDLLSRTRCDTCVRRGLHEAA